MSFLDKRSSRRTIIFLILLILIAGAIRYFTIKPQTIITPTTATINEQLAEKTGIIRSFDGATVKVTDQEGNEQAFTLTDDVRIRVTNDEGIFVEGKKDDFKAGRAISYYLLIGISSPMSSSVDIVKE
ncbi:hypothetical protein HYW32_03270 [Candidatus Berkelbacteria bacterium]|nr:hypothetical protein [Candidatus Berkelbacteria bacterium]